MKVAIWGATDFVGGAIARVIGATGYTLRLMGPPHTLSTNPPGRRVEQRIAPMADRHALERALAGQDVLIYAEPYRPRTHMPRDTALHEGVDRIRTLLSAARKAGVAHTIYLGSAITVGRPPSEGKRLTELDLYMPGQRDDDPWFDVAYAMECEVLAANSYTMHTSALMYTTPIGPGRALPAPIMAMVQGRLPLIWDGRCNVIDVRALAGTAFQAIRLARAGQRYLLAGHSTSLRKLAEAVAQHTHRSLPRVVGHNADTPSLAQNLAVQVAPQWALEWMRLAACPGPFDTTKARAELQHKPRRLQESIRDMVASVDASDHCP